LLSEISSYATFYTYRSVISLIALNEMGSHPLIQRFFNGVASLKPQRFRYNFIWGSSPVNEYLSTLYPHENLALEIISRNLVTFLALTTAQRM